MKIKFVTLLIFTLFCNFSMAQKSKDGYPKTLTSAHYDGFHKLKDKDKDKYSFDVAFDAEKERKKEKKKEKTCKTCTLPYYGKEISVNIDFFKKAHLKKLDDGGKLWLLKLKTKDSEGFQFIFNNFKLEEGCELIIYDKSQENFLGKFTEENNREDKLFVTQPIFGKEVYIEYYQPSDVNLNYNIILEKVVCIFDNTFLRRGPFVPWPDENEECMINTSCSDGFGWKEEIKSVVLILEKQENDDYWGVCTGSLINKIGNYMDSDKPYFLSANHCYDLGGNFANLKNWVFLFRHETTFCDDDGSGLDNYPTKSVVGATLVSNDENSDKSDYLLLQLKDDVETISKYDVTFAGWTRVEYEAYDSRYVSIHHPKGDVKKISTSETNVVSSGNAVNQNLNSYWRVYWSNGVTAPGSSGSPLFNSSHQLIGQLQGGWSYCEDHFDENGDQDGGPDWPDYYGKFSTSWTHGNFANYLGNGYSCSHYSSSVPNLEISISSNPNIIIPGTNVEFLATSSNAIGNLTCYWVINKEEGELDSQCDPNNDSNCFSSYTNPSSTFNFANSGSYRITCHALDSEGKTASKDYILNVGDNLDPCIQVNMYMNTDCNQEYAYPNDSELQIWDYAFAEFCWDPLLDRLVYNGIRAIRWYVDNNLYQTFDDFNKTDECFVVIDNCYWPGQARTCIDLSTLAVGTHTIRMDAYAGKLTGGVFYYASGSPRSTISTEIRVYDPNSTIIYNNQYGMPLDQSIYHKEVSFLPQSYPLTVGDGHSMAIYADKIMLKPGVILENGSHCIFSKWTSDMSNCTCTPIVKSARIISNEMTVNDVTSEEINIYPNPVTDKVIIELGSDYKNVDKIEIFDSEGRLLFNQDCELNSINSINTNDFNSGLYIVKISFPHKQVVRKLVKNE